MNNSIKFTPLICILTIAALLTCGFSFDSSEQEETKKQTIISNQIWGVQVEVVPGETGALEQKIEAAHGPYDSEVDKDSASEIDKDSFGFVEDDDGTTKVVKGEDYVGSYFNIEQLAHTTGGILKRYIDISSLWSHGYLHEDMSVVGEAKIEESFSMDNLSPGSDASITWYDLF